MANTAPEPSCISRPASAMSASESSRASAMHHVGFLQASPAHGDLQEMDRLQGAGVVSDGSFSSGFSSSFGSLGIASDMACDDDENEDDGSLQDTACSSAARPKAKYFVDASSRQQATGAAQEVVSGANNNEKLLGGGNNDLRKRGLCLVPFSLLIDYL